MSYKFSCSLKHSEALKERVAALFQSDTGDECTVKYKSNVCRDLLLNIEWTVPKHVLVTAELYSKTFKRCFSSKGCIVNGRKAFMKLRGAFNVCSSLDYDILCLINVTPYVKFNKSKERSATSESGYEEADSLMETELCSSVDKNCISHANTKLAEMAIKTHEIKVTDDLERSQTVVEQEFQKFPIENCNFPLADKTSINKTKVCTIVTSAEYSANVTKVPKTESEDILKDKRCSTVDLNDTVTRNAIGFEAAAQNEFIKDENVSENEIQHILSPINSLTPGNTDKRDISNEDMQILKVVPTNEFSSKIGSLTETQPHSSSINNENLALATVGDEVTDNLETNIHDESPTSDNCAVTDSSTDIEQQDILSHNMNSITANNSNANINKILTLDDISEKISMDTEIEFPKLPMDEHKVCKSSSVDSVICNTDIDVDAELASNDISRKTHTFKEIDLQKSMDQHDLITSNLEEVSINDTPLKVHEALELNDVIKETFLVTGRESKSFPKDKSEPITSEGGEDVILNTAMDGTKPISSSLMSENFHVVSETLIRGLSVDNDATSADIHETVVSNTEIKCDKSLESNDAPSKQFPVMESELNGLSMDMLDLLMSGDMTDSIISNGKKEMKVHKAIVSARSPVFKKLFTSLTEEKKEIRVSVNIPNNVLEDLMVFMYTGVINIKNTGMAQELHKIAVKYCISDLRDISSKYISK